MTERVAYTTAEVAAMLGSTTGAGLAQVQRGVIPAHRIGRRWMIPAAYVARLGSLDTEAAPQEAVAP